MSLESIALMIILFLVAIICFLLYKLYRIKYTERTESSFIPKNLKKEIMDLSDGKESLLYSKLKEIEKRIHMTENKLDRQKIIIEKLAEELGE